MAEKKTRNRRRLPHRQSLQEQPRRNFGTVFDYPSRWSLVNT